MKARRIARNIWRTEYGWRVFAKIKGKLWPKRITDNDHRLELPALEATRDAWAKELQGPYGSAVSGTFHADAGRYLDARKAMTGIVARRKQIALWVAEFGDRPRASVQSWEILRVRDRWLTEGPKCVYRDKQRVYIAAPLSASTVNQRLRALENIWTVLDGRKADNPVREVAEAEEPEATARGLPPELVDAILAKMPDRRYGRALTSDDAKAIRHALRGRRRWGQITEQATKYGVSETMIRKIAAGRAKRDDEASATKLRLAAIFLNGLSHGELMAITEPDLHLAATPPWAWIAGRRKGKGTTGTAQPLTAKGAAALQALVDAKKLGKFSRDSMRASFRRAWKKLNLKGLRPYDLRHSFATDVLHRTGNLDVTQMLLRHRDKRTTLRYTKAAVSPLLVAAVEALERGNQKKLPPREKMGKRGDSRGHTAGRKRGKNRSK